MSADLDRRAEIMDKSAQEFLDKTISELGGMNNGDLASKMLGTIAGAVAVMVAIEMPFANIEAGIKFMLEDMKS